ncbi:MAG: Flp pilus assembly complex ATPase component TadA [Candidatus Altiarchaeota archaeon]|nr:Flp pilus assembly complex ATPase component TadA [Candidatus Altiarchaeota archaeon]
MDSRIVPDTSVIIDGRITEILKEAKGKTEVIIPEAAVAELENQANLGRETGFDGLNELKDLKKMADESGGTITISFRGKTPSEQKIKLAREGLIDELIRKTAEENDALLVTSDKIQALVSEAKGLKVRYIGPRIKIMEPRIFELFTPETASLHLKENTPAYAKKGSVGQFELAQVRPNVTREELEEYSKEIIATARSDPKSYMETEKRGVSVIQLREYRIVIARPPFSDGLEITAVRPLVKTKLSDYELSKKLLERLSERAEGIFVAGAPGQGKSTFAQALAEYYLSKGKIIKTMEHPRDLQVPDTVTQYAGLEGSMEATGDILLLLRPDYTIYDEVRKTKDFQVFADMRLAGVGLVGVTHANKAIDAVQRLVGRVELGIIPHVVDTIIFLEAGRIKEVYELRMTVKVPYGMREADLARPVVEIRDFETGRPQYEIYTFGEEVVVIPVKQKSPRGRTTPEKATISRTKKIIILRSPTMRDEQAKVCADGAVLFTARVNRAGNIKIKRNSENGRILQEALSSGKEIETA